MFPPQRQLHPCTPVCLGDRWINTQNSLWVQSWTACAVNQWLQGSLNCLFWVVTRGQLLNSLEQRMINSVLLNSMLENWAATSIFSPLPCLGEGKSKTSSVGYRASLVEFSADRCWAPARKESFTISLLYVSLHLSPQPFEEWDLKFKFPTCLTAADLQDPLSSKRNILDSWMLPLLSEGHHDLLQPYQVWWWEYQYPLACFTHLPPLVSSAAAVIAEGVLGSQGFLHQPEEMAQDLKGHFHGTPWRQRAEEVAGGCGVPPAHLLPSLPDLKFSICIMDTLEAARGHTGLCIFRTACHSVKSLSQPYSIVSYWRKFPPLSPMKGMAVHIVPINFYLHYFFWREIPLLTVILLQ